MPLRMVPCSDALPEKVNTSPKKNFASKPYVAFKRVLPESRLFNAPISSHANVHASSDSYTVSRVKSSGMSGNPNMGKSERPIDDSSIRRLVASVLSEIKSGDSKKVVDHSQSIPVETNVGGSSTRINKEKSILVDLDEISDDEPIGRRVVPSIAKRLKNRKGK